LGHFTTDQTGFVTAQLLWTALGAVNAALVVDVARRCGLRPSAALAGGLFYALWFGAAAAEYLTRLEPLGNLFLLLALRQCALTRQRTGSAQRQTLLIAGVAAALAASTNSGSPCPCWSCSAAPPGSTASPGPRR
jgi:hypothetical protein